jgi:hypothetical protein
VGFLRKFGRKIDRGIRKVFGKNGWLKAAATVAALYFIGPAAISQGIGKVGTALKTGAEATAKFVTGGDATGFTSMTDSVSTFMSDGRHIFERAAGTPVQSSMVKDGVKLSQSPLMDTLSKITPQFAKDGASKAYNLGVDVIDSAVKGQLLTMATGSDDYETFGSTKGVQDAPSLETSASFGEAVEAFAVSQPQSLPTISLGEPTYARMAV